MRTAWLAGKIQAGKFGLDWVTQQWLYFLDKMPETLSAAQLAELDKAYGLTRSQNAEIEHSWLRIVIRNNYQQGYARLEQYLTTIGRRKLIEPLYTDLMKTPAGSAFAKRVYAKAKPGYHPETVRAIEGIVNPDAADSSE
jgi:leukotriene-A4 hydrolase